MPIITKVDRGIPGEPVPLESQQESTGTGMLAEATAAIKTGIGADLAIGLQRATAGGSHVSAEDARKQMKAQNMDATVIPEDGLSSGALRTIIDHQADVQAERNVADRSSAGPVSRFVAGLAGSTADPVNIALLPFGAGEAAIGRSALGRLIVGAKQGAIVMTGAEAVHYPAARYAGDPYTVYDSLNNIVFGTVAGGALHMAFGARPNAQRIASGKEAIASVMHAEDATGIGIVTTDTGGLTKFGISQRAHPDVDIKNLTAADAEGIIKKQYWNKINGDGLAPDIQRTALDAAVNQGVGNARKWLKEAKGSVARFNELRRAHYEMLAEKNPAKYSKYLKGWLNRLDKIEGQGPIRTEFGLRPTENVQSLDYTETRNWGTDDREISEALDEFSQNQRNEATRVAMMQAFDDSPIEVLPIFQRMMPGEDLAAFRPKSDMEMRFEKGGDLSSFRVRDANVRAEQVRENLAPKGEIESRLNNPEDLGAFKARMGYDEVPPEPEGALTNAHKIADEHAAEVRSIETQAFENVGRKLGLEHAIPVRGRIMHDEVALASVNKTVEEAVAPTEKEAPLVAEAQQHYRDAVAEAKSIAERVGDEPSAALETALSDENDITDEGLKAIEAAVRCVLIKGE